jgi:acyl-CoA reductase-like NAD-dependent aldehyde dehydrogenase
MLSIWNPATGQVVQQVPEDTEASIARKAAAARAAQPAWADLALDARIAVLRRFRALLAERKEDLARTLTAEVGKPITQSRNELNGVLGRIDWATGAAPEAFAEEEVHREAGMRERVSREPLGVVANVSAWNYPYFVGTNVFVPALLAGNAVLYKPSEHATLTGLAIARLLHESGVPEDVFPAIVGAGDAGAALLRQEVDGVFFTGSHATGRKVAETMAGRMVHVQLELGGKDPAYACDDVDVAAAAASLADGAFYNAGQSCCSVERVYVHERVHDEFLDAFLATVKAFHVGDPMDERTYVGPLARRGQRAVLEAQVADARAKGARLLCGGKRVEGPGWWFEPTVLADVDHSMDVMRAESFGPVIGIQRVRDDDEALRRMNDTPYGLTAAVYSRDEARARRILRRVHAGSAYWNCCDRVSPRLPWSGRGHSGMGATLGRDGLLAMTRPKAWHLRGA